MVRPPSPMTMPFWLSRSTYSTARIYTGSALSRNSSISDRHAVGQLFVQRARTRPRG